MIPTPPRCYRSALPPLVLILAVTGGCESSEKRAARLAEEARLREIQEKAARLQAEVEKPHDTVLGQIRGAAEAYMKEQHGTEELDELVFTQLTPNLYLLGLKLRRPENARRSLTAERFRNDDGDGDFYWVIDEATQEKMKELTRRHGFDQEVDKVAAGSGTQDWGDDDSGGWVSDASGGTWNDPHRHHTASWLGPILLWHYLYGRPSPVGYSYRNPQRGFSAFASGYRYNAPRQPFTPAVRDRLGAIPAQTGGHSAVFLGGTAWAPRSMGDHPGLNSARIYSAAPRGGTASRVSPGSVSRGGFGGSGHAAGTSGSHASGSHAGS